MPGAGVDEARVVEALRGEVEQGRHSVPIGLEFILHSDARTGLRDFHLLAGFSKLRRQESNAAAFNARVARRLDGGRCFIEAFFEKGVFGSGQQALTDFSEAGAG